MQIISCQAALGSRGSILQEAAVSALSMMAFQQQQALGQGQCFTDPTLQYR